MKKHFLVLIALFCSLQNLVAQYVEITDPNFQAALKALYPTCFNENNLLDTNCPEILNTNSLNIGSKNINSIAGIKYFKNLKSLECYNNNIQDYSELPKSLTYLNCATNNLNSLESLPDSLKTLHCFGNLITEFKSLPKKLGVLMCFANKLVNLSNLPPNLTFLYCGNNPNISTLILPKSLTTLNYQNSELKTLPELPNTLKQLKIDDNLFTTLPNLPDSLVELSCTDNPGLTCLPKLPEKLNDLYISSETIQCLPNNQQNLKVYNGYYNPSIISLPICDQTFNPNNCAIIAGIDDEVNYQFNILYPNPAKNKITINTKGSEEIKIFNNYGDLIFQQVLNGSQDIDIQFLKPDLYYYTIGRNKGKFMVE